MFNFLSRLYFTPLIICIFTLFNGLKAAEINISVKQTIQADHALVTVINNSSSPLLMRGIKLQLYDYTNELESSDRLAANSQKKYRIQIKKPQKEGTYALISTIRYFNEGKKFTLNVVGQHNQNKKLLSAEKGQFSGLNIVEEGLLEFTAKSPNDWQIILPEELHVRSDKTQGNKRKIQLQGFYNGFENNYPIYAIYSKDTHRGVQTALTADTLHFNFAKSFQRGAIPEALLLGIILISFILSGILLLTKQNTNSHILQSLTKYSSAVFFVCVAYYLLRHGDHMSDQISRWDLWEIPDLLIAKTLGFLHIKHFNFSFEQFWTITRDNFRGSNYQYFFKYVADYYTIGILLFLFPYVYFTEKNTDLKDNKWCASLAFIFSLIYLFSAKKKINWNYQARLGFLSFAVKIFYIPLLSTWVINNTYHQWNLGSGLQWDLRSINAYLMALFIYVDTSIFAFGYIVESHFLKNKIKSVEPTILGWVVCLWCYPPFNNLSFKIFDLKLLDIHIENTPEWLDVIMLLVISLGWGVFAWASIALGFRASNLTNRGIVKQGPYRFCRHPAYSIKVIVWIMEGIFFGRYFLGLLLGFIFIYGLRALTEERHLSKDPDYISYKKEVPWRFIPGIF